MASKANQQIQIRLVRSHIGSIPKHRAILNALGLKRIRQERSLENTPAVRGMIKKVLHLVEVVGQ